MHNGINVEKTVNYKIMSRCINVKKLEEGNTPRSMTTQEQIGRKKQRNSAGESVRAPLALSESVIVAASARRQQQRTLGGKGNGRMRGVCYVSAVLENSRNSRA